MLPLNECPDKDTNYQNGQHIGAQRIVQKVIPHCAIREKGHHIVKPKEGLSPERDEAHDPEAYIGNQRDVVPNASSQNLISVSCNLQNVTDAIS
jgi:hypothetical protein